MNSQQQHFTTRHYVTFAVVAILVIAAGLWAFNRLSSDAIGMALGLGFGVLAGIPAALLVFVASRPRSPYDYRDDDDDYRPQTTVPPQTVIIIQSPTALAPWNSSAGNEQRKFVIVPCAEPQRELPPWERKAQIALPPPQSGYAIGEHDTQWRYPVESIEMANGAPVRLAGEVTITTNLCFALATGARCYVRLDEWDQHVAQLEQAQNWGQYAYRA